MSILAASGCAADESTVEVPPRPAYGLEDAAERTLAAGPARIAATVRAGRVRYRLRGRWDPTRGYRVCARIVRAPIGYFEGRVLWLEGLNRSYGTLTGQRCGRNRSWLDDHPPTLPLFGIEREPAGVGPGAEDHLHAALLALGGMSDSGVIDFRAFDRDPTRRDEDGWTLRPLLRRLETRRVRVTVDRDGFVERLRLVGPRRVVVTLRLAGFGEEPRVPHVNAYSIE
jgi:hypothetical protein